MPEGFPPFDRSTSPILQGPSSSLEPLSPPGPSCRAKETTAIYHELKSWLVDYRFLPGERLHIADLANRLGVSATPVREALNRLHAEDFLLSIPNKGFFSKVLGLQEMIDLHDTARMLLGNSVYGHAGTCTPADLGDPASPPGTGTESPADLARAVETLFERVVGLARNKVMSAVMRNINDRTHYVRTIDLQMPGRPAQVRAEIGALALGLARRDRRMAADALDSHFGRLADIMPDLVKEGISRRYTA